MIGQSRKERCSALLEEWRRPRLTSKRLSEVDLRNLTRALLEHCLREGCRAELLDASAAYRSMDDFVRALLEQQSTHKATVRLALPADDETVADHYLAVWRSYGTPEEHFGSDAREQVLQFLADSRERFQGGCLLAEASGDVRGSVGYQIQVPQFPEVLRADVRKVGYIWTVYVDPQSRRQGVASLMVERALASLKQIGCTTAILHASEAGAPVYTRLGFRAGPEMRLKL